MIVIRRGRHASVYYVAQFETFGGGSGDYGEKYKLES